MNFVGMYKEVDEWGCVFYHLKFEEVVDGIPRYTLVAAKENQIELFKELELSVASEEKKIDVSDLIKLKVKLEGMDCLLRLNNVYEVVKTNDTGVILKDVTHNLYHLFVEFKYLKGFEVVS